MTMTTFAVTVYRRPCKQQAATVKQHVGLAGALRKTTAWSLMKQTLSWHGED